MFRATPRLIARPAARTALPKSVAPVRRYISTAPPTQKSRSWKSLGARLAIAGTLIYYYNTTDVFAEEPAHAVHALPEVDTESENFPTIEAISAERQKRKAVQAQLDAQAQKDAQSKQQNALQGAGPEGGIGGLEEEADQQGAFNPETGEINWDCPCLGGMATGPCGDEFKAAFSCFVFSEEEPKGMDCIDKFKDMQNCFRKYPEVYGSELEGDAEDEDDLAADLPTPSSPALAPDSAPQSPVLSTTSSTAHLQSSQSPTGNQLSGEREAGRSEKAKRSSEPSPKPSAQEKAAEKATSGLALVPDAYKPETKTKEDLTSESESLVPKAAHDAGDENTKQIESK